MAVDRSASPDVQRLHLYTQLNAPMAETNFYAHQRIFVDCAPPVRSWSTWSPPVRILILASTVLTVVSAGVPYGKHVKASEVVFLSVCCCCPWFAVRLWFWPHTFVILYFHEMPSILLCHLWCAASRLFVNVTANNGHISAPYRRADKIIIACLHFQNNELTGFLNHAIYVANYCIIYRV